jgi:Ax21 family sulfation-dependent quorum factor
MENLRMRRTVWISALALSLALPLAAQAAEFDYSWLEAGYTSIEADDGPDADGWALNGSAAIAPQVHVFGSYAGTELDGVNIDGDVMRLGLGWNTGIAEAHDLVVRANYLKVDTDFPGGDGDGYEAEVGLRSALGANFETYVAAGYADIDRGSGDLYGKLGAQYKFSPGWGLAATVTLADGANEYFIGPRLNF